MRFATLPFVSTDSHGVIESTWSVSPTGDHGRDCATGREYCADLMGAIIEDGNTLHLPRVIEGQVRSGQWSGIEIGFHAALAEQVEWI